MNFPQTVEELIRWPVYTDRDSLGIFHIITGYEGTRCCFWCGEPLTGRLKRYCRAEVTDDDFVEDILSDNVPHWKQYWRHFCYTYAAPWCLKRYDYTCANCGRYGNLEAHHIIPLEGGDRAWSVYNVPWNLICFCHDCHQLIHSLLRELKQPIPPDTFDLAIARGQAVFEPLRLI